MLLRPTILQKTIRIVTQQQKPLALAPSSIRNHNKLMGSLTAVPQRTAAPPPDKFVEHETLAEHQQRTRHDDPANRTFNYAMVGGARFIGAAAWRVVLIKCLAQMNPAADVLAMASLEVDITKLNPGDCMTVKWRGKPVFIRSRTEAEVETERAVDVASLRDPESDVDRCEKPETFVVLGICTHLGCVPITGAGDFAGWFCPCHGSHYDASGRIRKGPAPLNMEVPPYQFLDESKIVIG